MLSKTLRAFAEGLPPRLRLWPGGQITPGPALELLLGQSVVGGHFDPAGGRGPASELKLVPVGQGGNHPGVRSMSSPVAELLTGEISNSRPRSLIFCPPTPRRRGGGAD